MADHQQTTDDSHGVELRLTEIRKSFGELRALDGASLSIKAGECVAIVGESGSGKTTLLRSINRLVELDSGSIEIDGRSILDFNTTQLRRSLGYVPQDGGLIPHWRVLRNVALVPWLCGMSDANERALHSLDVVGFESSRIAERWPHELSGGQRQRVAMARALAAGQKCLLLDEPFGALDAITRAELQKTFKTLHKRSSFTAILVTHDLREALSLADRVAVMYRGKIEQVAAPDELRRSPSTKYVAKLLEYAEVA